MNNNEQQALRLEPGVRTPAWQMNSPVFNSRSPGGVAEEEEEEEELACLE
jgi:hypothetical protein